MKSKRNGMAIAGGILGIIAGALSLFANVVLVVLAKGLTEYIGGSLDILKVCLYIILPLAIIIQGAQAVSGKAKSLITFAVTDLLVVVLQLLPYFGVNLETDMGLGLVQCVLLVLASIMYFCAHSSCKQ